MCVLTTKDATYQYRLAQWAELMRERVELGLSIRAYCSKKGFAENTYFYWQRRLREAACSEVTERTANAARGLIPGGWTQVSCAAPESAEPTLRIEVNGCLVNVTSGTDPELLAVVCRTLKNL